MKTRKSGEPVMPPASDRGNSPAPPPSSKYDLAAR